MTETYNGWKNRQTWNVALWINNDEPLYRAAVEFMKANRDCKDPYRAFTRAAHLNGRRTPDGCQWQHATLDYKALNEMMRELID